MVSVHIPKLLFQTEKKNVFFGFEEVLLVNCVRLKHRMPGLGRQTGKDKKIKTEKNLPTYYYRRTQTSNRR